MIRLVKRAVQGLARSVDSIWTDRWLIWQGSYRRYLNNPYNIDPTNFTREAFLELAEKAKNRDFSPYFDELSECYEHHISKDYVDDLALSTQVAFKRSQILYAHGYLLYSALREYLDRFEGDPVILETGTARGFGTICMAKALKDAGRDGRIYSIDVVPGDVPIYWNCIHDLDGPKTRYDVLAKWSELVDKYLVFFSGYSQRVLRQLALRRVHFAFLDSGHDYHDIRVELEYVAARQETGDVIVCDDYNKKLFPGVVRAIEEHLEAQPYDHKFFEAADGRGYVVCTRR